MAESFRRIYRHALIFFGILLVLAVPRTVQASPETVFGGIDYAPVYQYSYYIRKYPDLRKAYGHNKAKVLRHFVRYGMREGRQASPSFQVQYYRRRYADLRKAYGGQLMKYYVHYLRHGIKEGRFPTAAAEQRWRRDRRFIMVGDSNAEILAPGRSNQISWPELVSRGLGLSDSQVRFCRKGGYGFNGLAGRFADLIRDLPPDSKVTDVLVVGGAGNDRKYSYQKIADGYREFVRLVRTKYPNARIIHTVPNWSLRNLSYQKAVLANIPLYQRLASENACIYLKGPETVLRGHEEYYFSDKLHWNLKGERAVSNELVYRIMMLDKNKYGI